MHHPLIKNRETIIPFMGIWFFVIVVQFFSLFISSKYSLSYCLADSIMSSFTYMVITLTLWYPVRFGINSVKSPYEMIINNLLIYALTSSIWIMVNWGLISIINPNWTPVYRETILSYKILTSLMLYIASVVIYYAIGFYESLQEKQAQELQLKTLVKEAQLNELRSQLHPHFLFNSLNSINSLTISNPEKAGEMIIKLSEFLRYSLSRKGSNMTNFEKELYHVQLYLDIEKVQIKLIAKTDQDMLTISISNNFDPETTNDNGTGTGLSNVKERLKLVYGQEGLLKTNIKSNEFVVILKIPKL